jgi:hypothetical protein
VDSPGLDEYCEGHASVPVDCITGLQHQPARSRRPTQLPRLGRGGRGFARGCCCEAVSGEAEGADQQLTEQLAWERACAALRAASGLDCRRDAWISTAKQMSLRQGVSSFSATVTLEPVIATLEGEAGAADPTAACELAVAEACRSAPRHTRCDSLGLSCEALAGGMTQCVAARHRRAPPGQ